MGWLSKNIPGDSPEGAPIPSVLGKQTCIIRNGCAAIPDPDRAIPFNGSDGYFIEIQKGGGLAIQVLELN